MKRTDIHAPSKIVPTDYEYVALCPSGLLHNCPALADLPFVQAEREIFKRHQEKTSGQYSKHEHGGSCYCCGAHAIYKVIFYHAKTNTYVKLGHICADKLDFAYNTGDFKAFRKSAKAASEFIAGKAKAQAILASKGLSEAWFVYEAPYDPRFEESTIKDLVSKLVKYGSLSEKQEKFLSNLLKQIKNRAAIEAKRAEEKSLASEAPTGKFKFIGTILSKKVTESYSPFGSQLKILVKHDSGFLAYGTCPKDLCDLEKGDRVGFCATFKQSPQDTKFAYFKRPTQATKL